ncbi:GTP-binding protein [Clostridium ganghwense]|uniref:TetM/TetW/TetO/TetS family tetracycline resistance ribosomal protection protein n=1 Tax=Clostridium ganghwense TaxID=312089 RepID=A0ABT4CQS6_9CLOT|nr:TetM/TetW/TetO/TetS family tetracycline resistance ribosomal protection protein [Clostridium ganghwense]MCY6371407.1 TetM/TetW/TetO/TetS family tetracycline resistance ribosomal protection protein [Clostridium ganghwense]
MKNIRNIGLVAHVDAGKTTTTEQMMYLSGNIRELGSVDKGSSKMDYNNIEKQRGITVFADQATLNWKNTIINIIDTPGHVDFSAELERALKALDGAILIISAVEGVQSHTETIWQLLRKYNIPTLLFINKLDRVGADLNRVYKEIQENLTGDFLPIHKVYKIEKDFDGFVDLINDKEYSWNSHSDFDIEDKMETEGKIKLIEKLADKDDFILEKYLEGEAIEKQQLVDSIKINIEECRLYPVLVGSSMNGIGISNLLDAVVDILPDNKGNDDKDFSAVIYKVKFDDSIGKLSYVRVLDGTIKVRDTIFNEFGEEEKITQIRKYNGEKYISIEKLISGEIGVLCGIKNGKIGDYLGVKKGGEEKEKFITSILISRVVPKNEEDLSNLLKAVEILNEEDPSLQMQWDSDKKQLSINIMGFVQMEVLKQLIKDRFNIEVELEKPKVNYVETIIEKSTGFCHFEPKKHYAEVEVEIEPNERGKGAEFISELSVDILPLQYQHTIEKAVYEGVKHGKLVGSNVTDIKIKLIAGKHHLEHTHGGDFRIAAIRAVQQALSKNKSILLEPLYRYKITVDKELAGKVMSDILRMSGNFEEPLILGDKICISGEVPISTAMYYQTELASATSGKAVVSMQFSRYDTCHNEEEVLANSENIVDKDDSLYNGVSLFREKKKMKKVVED